MKLIFLYGPAACGKLTVARELAALTNYPLFHNHLALDAVTAVFPFGSEPAIRLRSLYWLSMFEEAARQDRPLIFTFAPERTVPDSFIAETRAAVEGHGGAVLFVELAVSPEEQMRRVENPDRKASKKIHSREVLRKFRDGGGAAYPPIPADLVIDTEALAPEAAAQAIVEALKLEPLPEPHVAYPDPE
ncbi:MAG: AAA family ATPase [Phenylobacterium sp.]|uniref:AAA family ATPase n=1 Tax=Phenylobacterium sp. TaxID=1871053 RepID=UPI002720A223|nr:AAA family ATPase [Phenylobacterium sp.]MDO8899891.1 AAA family ATPase [Phenylobacterium sp.]